MRVLHVGCVLDPQRRPAAALLDAWPTLALVAGAVRAAGAEVTVLHAGHADEVLERAGVSYHFVAEPRVARLPGSRGGAGVLPIRLARRAAALRPDVVHLNGLEFPLHVRALAAALPNVPILLQDHAGRPPVRRRRLHRWGLAPAAGAAFTAAEQARPFVDAGILRRDLAIHEVPESTTTFAPGDVAAARAATGLFGDPALLWVGRLDANKDPLTILDAVALARRALPGLRLWCCFGDASLMDEVRARLARDALLALCVHLLGRVDHARIELLGRAADFLVLGSHHESTGYAVIEALACGATPVVTDIPAFRALTGDGRVGALLPPGDPQAFARALVPLAYASRAKLRQRARRHFELRLSPAALGARLTDVYEEMARARQPGRAAPDPGRLPGIDGSRPDASRRRLFAASRPEGGR